VEPLLFRDLDFRTSRQLLSLGRALAYDGSGCRVKVAEWTRSITFSPPLFALFLRRALRPQHKDESAVAEELLRLARGLRLLVLPETGSCHNHRLLATVTSVTPLPPLRHLSIAVRSEFLGCMGRIASLTDLRELHVCVQDEVANNDPRQLLTAEVTPWNLPHLRTLFIDLRGVDSRPDPLTDMMRFLSRCPLTALQVLDLRMVLNDETTADSGTNERLRQFLARRWSTVRVGLAADDDYSGNKIRLSTVSSVRAPILGLVDWFDPDLIDALAEEVKTLELYVSIAPLNTLAYAGEFFAPFELLDMCVAGAASGALGVRRIVFKLSPDSHDLRQSIHQRAQRLDAYTVYGSALLAYAARLRRLGIQCNVSEILAGKSASAFTPA
jgi:hypothetical protein